MIGERAALDRAAAGPPVILWAGWPFFERGVKSVINRSLNMFHPDLSRRGRRLPVQRGGGAHARHLPGRLPQCRGPCRVYFEAGAVIVVLVLLGQLMELGARERTGSAIRALLDLAAKTASGHSPDGREEEILPEDVVVGDQLRVRPATRCRSMAWCSKVARRSTSR